MAKPHAEVSRKLLANLFNLLKRFERGIDGVDVRKKVIELIPVSDLVCKLGKSLISPDIKMGARDRILAYLQKYPLTIIKGKELMIVSGIGEWARRVRELRVQFGWSIVSGESAKEMIAEKELDPVINNQDLSKMKVTDYILLSKTLDKEAAYRWNVANSIRREKKSVKQRIIDFMRKNVGAKLSGEELRYVAGNKKEWARRVRELRTEEGWPIVTKSNGNPDLPVGIYVLEADRQSPPHDRTIPDPVRRQVLIRDTHTCQNKKCNWNFKKWDKSDPRHIELHHLKEHAKGGTNVLENLISLCNICHDLIHSKTKEAEIKF